jgi:hypothetical protein
VRTLNGIALNAQANLPVHLARFCLEGHEAVQQETGDCPRVFSNPEIACSGKVSKGSEAVKKLVDNALYGAKLVGTITSGENGLLKTVHH